MKIAINGVGIAGPTLAYWLHQYGYEPVLFDKAPHLRSGGYMIDFWGLGYTVAERMGILPMIKEAGYQVQALQFVDAQGELQAEAPMSAFHRLANERFTSLPRGDLAAEIFRTVEGKVETHFHQCIVGLKEHSDGVNVSLSDGSTRDFDLVIGADGLHSQVRQLVFGAEEQFEKYLGLRVAAFEVQGYPHRNEDILVGHSQPGLQVMRFSKRGGNTLFLLVFLESLLTRPEPSNAEERKAVIHQVFGQVGWESPEILTAMDQLDDIYLDRVSQIQMDSWSQGRVALVGDAAACASLLAGQGSSLAMAEAYILAGELCLAQGNYKVAFENYEKRLQAFLLDKQRSATRLASSFAPKRQMGIWLRNLGLGLLHFPWIANLLVGPSLKDDFDLPDYSQKIQIQ